MKNKTATRALCEGAALAAMAQILSWLKLWELPQGGSVNIGMLPVVFFAVRWGAGRGLVCALAYSVLQLIFDGGYAWSWQSIIGDYIAAFTLMGLAGVFRGVRGGIFCGCALASILRFLSSWITGATVWAEYMPEEFFGATMTSPWVYSALYNGFYSAVNGALCILIFALMYRPMRRYILAEDIESR